jgi:hypothetical protein
MLIPQLADMSAFVFYSTALGIGMIVGAKLGADFACSVDGVLLRRFFGAILVFPLVHLMNLGQSLLDPLGTSILLSTLGDVIIWLVVVSCGGIVWIIWRMKEKEERIIEAKDS